MMKISISQHANHLLEKVIVVIVIADKSDRENSSLINQLYILFLISYFNFINIYIDYIIRISSV